MVGICSFGGYVPRYRLDRGKIFSAMGWVNSGNLANARGEKAVANVDEDSITMAVAAGRDALRGMDRSQVDGVYFASSTLPYKERLNSGIITGALGLDDQVRAADFTGGLKAGTTALLSALEGVESKRVKSLLVTAADCRMILRQDAGSFSWFGQPGSPETRKQIGALLETPNLYHYLSAVDNLRITQAISGRGVPADIDKVIDIVGLTARKKSKFSTYSLGMKQRLAIGAALLGSPQVLVFDEPTNGLDPVGIAEIRELIKNLAKQGKTIIMASHLLDEVEKVCTHASYPQKRHPPYSRTGR